MQKVKKLEQEVENLRNSSGFSSSAASYAGSIEDNIDRMSITQRTDSVGSGTGGVMETTVVRCAEFLQRCPRVVM